MSSRSRSHSQEKLTSENAGADIFLYLFHSSFSEATILGPKKDSALYCSTGFGNRARDNVTSWTYEQ